MKSTAVFASLLASAALVQGRAHGHGRPHRRHVHGHHEKRGIVTDWVTETIYETVTLLVDESTTETIMPTSKFTPPVEAPSSTTTTSAQGGQFYETSQAQQAPPSSTAEPVVVAPP
jgi:hypothetical protein